MQEVRCKGHLCISRPELDFGVLVKLEHWSHKSFILYKAHSVSVFGTSGLSSKALHACSGVSGVHGWMAWPVSRRIEGLKLCWTSPIRSQYGIPVS
jgi:hypothetical protein